METINIILNAILFVFIMPTLVRMSWHFYQRRVGTWNPDNFHKWVWWPWRWIVEKTYIAFIEWKADELIAGKKANAGWGGLPGRLVALYKPGDVLLGGLGYFGFRLFQPLGFKAERHLAMVAGTGSGKTTFLITMLGLHRGNAFVVDPKGQIAKIIAKRRGRGSDKIVGMGKDVNILDPNNIVKTHDSACWNAMDELALVEQRHGRKAVVRFARKMAAALVLHVQGEKPYFPKSARAIIRSIILYVYAVEPAEKRNMLRVRQLLAQGLYAEMIAEGATAGEAASNGFECLLIDMAQNDDPDFGESIRNGAKTVLDSGRSKGDVLSTAREAMDFYDIPEISRISKASDFSLLDLKCGNSDLFICAPTGDIRETYSGWFRLLSVMALDLFEQTNHQMDHPTLFAIDEMPSIGYIEAIAISAPVLRSYGVRLLAITQDIALLKKAYPAEWSSFLGSADVTYWMANKHKDSLEYLSQDLGEATLYNDSRPWWRRWRFWQRGYKTPFTQTVMTPDQLSRVLAPNKENMITTRYGKRALRVKTMPYYKELPVRFYDADADHGEKMFRAITRQGGEPVLLAASAAGGVIKQVADGLADPDAENMTMKDAMALYGLSGAYTAAQVKQQRKALQPSAEHSPIMRAAVESSYAVLMSNLQGSKAT